jgi:hypothetical protein
MQAQLRSLLFTLFLLTRATTALVVPIGACAGLFGAVRRCLRRTPRSRSIARRTMKRVRGNIAMSKCYLALLGCVFIFGAPAFAQITIAGVPLSSLATQATGTVVANVSGSTASPTAISMANLQSALNSANAITYTPTLASGATNDWDPSGGSGITTVGFVYATPNALGSTLDGVLAGSDKQQFILCNAATLGTNAEYIILENQDSSDSTAANRLAMAGNTVLGPQMCAEFTYVTALSRWLVSAIAAGNQMTVDPLVSTTSATPDCSFQMNIVTVSSGTSMTINAPNDCTPQDGQILRLNITSSSSGAATYAWNAAYIASATLALPTTANASSKEDRFVFQWSATASSWLLLAYNQGFTL